jgi:single-strand binding protein
MNVVCLLGRLTADPELRHTATQIPVTSFTIAVDRAYQPKGAEQRQADFINIVAWRQTAEFITRYFRKGQRIALQGQLQSRPFTDKEGNKRTAYEVVVDNAFFAESKNSGAPAGGNRYDSQIPQYNESQPAFSTAASGDFEEIVGDDDLPF